MCVTGLRRRANTTRADRSLTGRWQCTCLRTAASMRDSGFLCNYSVLPCEDRDSVLLCEAQSFSTVSYFDGVSFSRQNTTRADRSLTGRWQGTCLRTASSVRDFFCNTISEDSCFIWNYGISPSLRSSVLSISFFDVVSVLDAISFIWVRPGETIHNKNKYHNKY